jgi:hypothetical protein
VLGAASCGHEGRGAGELLHGQARDEIGRRGGRPSGMVGRRGRLVRIGVGQAMPSAIARWRGLSREDG